MAEEVVDFKLFRYDPSMGAAVLFMLLFLVAASLHTYQCIVTRTWFFTAFVVGCWFEVIGFLTRAIAAGQAPDFTVPVYSSHTIFVLVAPSVFAASIYMVLGRIMLITDGEQHSIIRGRWLTKIFVVGDVVSFLMQGAGGGIMASGSLDAMTLGENVIIGGLVVQILFFTCFVVTAGIFHARLIRVPTNKSMQLYQLWPRSLYSLYAGSALIWVRCVFRLIEYAQGNDGYLISHEAYLYIFDALLMFIVMLIFAVVHPSEVNAQLCGPGAKKLERGIFAYVQV